MLYTLHIMLLQASGVFNESLYSVWICFKRETSDNRVCGTQWLLLWNSVTKSCTWTAELERHINIRAGGDTEDMTNNSEPGTLARGNKQKIKSYTVHKARNVRSKDVVTFTPDTHTHKAPGLQPVSFPTTNEDWFHDTAVKPVAPAELQLHPETHYMCL